MNPLIKELLDMQERFVKYGVSALEKGNFELARDLMEKEVPRIGQIMEQVSLLQFQTEMSKIVTKTLQDLL